MITKEKIIEILKESSSAKMSGEDVVLESTFGEIAQQILAEIKPDTSNAIPFQCCPLCNGNGRVLAGGSSVNVYQTCTVCNGNKVIPMIAVNSAETTYSPTRRDYFAGRALEGLMANHLVVGSPGDYCETTIRIADELIKQLDQ